MLSTSSCSRPDFLGSEQLPPCVLLSWEQAALGIDPASSLEGGWLKPLPGTPHTAGRRWEGSWTRARGCCSGPGSAGCAALGKSLRHFESCRLQLHNGAGILSALKDPVS